MPTVRTTLVAVAAGGALVTTGLVATTATAAPAPVAAVSAVAADAGTVDGPRREGARRWWDRLSDEQRGCLRDQEVTRPVGPLDEAQRQALREEVTAAAQACDVELPFAKARAFWSGLSEEQQQCLQDAAVTRPWGPLAKEQRQQVRADRVAAAAKCGVTLPERPARSGS